MFSAKLAWISFRKLEKHALTDAKIQRGPLHLVSNFINPLFLIILILVSVTLSCAGKGTSHMTQDQLLAAIDQGTAPMIVDVRSQSEYESGHVPSAQHLPFYAMWSHHDEMEAKPEDPIVLYCEHGPRAWIGKFALWTVGYKNVVYLEDHMSGWKEQGLPTVKISPNH